MTNRSICEVGEFFTLRSRAPGWMLGNPTVDSVVQRESVTFAAASRLRAGRMKRSLIPAIAIDGGQSTPFQSLQDGKALRVHDVAQDCQHVLTVDYDHGECQFVLVDPSSDYCLTFSSSLDPARRVLACEWTASQHRLIISGPEAQSVTVEVNDSQIMIVGTYGLLPATDSGDHYLIGNLNALLSGWLFAEARRLRIVYGDFR